MSAQLSYVMLTLMVYKAYFMSLSVNNTPACVYSMRLFPASKCLNIVENHIINFGVSNGTTGCKCITKLSMFEMLILSGAIILNFT